ncbi:GntR family transcriptional regulator [Micromonospora sp. DR5-3]|uniref:GntR family transcriptional regulator n=1 Tax=unclassified Micromonospora TaxID=2617518 RepID=UPI0021057F32|nr:MULTISPECIES: GntR family transcriptional regulator [unclassified Micromonospora]MCW3815863.1 GntR family transcriptional regulator [Micromonospora sp. DR5-3]
MATAIAREGSTEQASGASRVAAVLRRRIMEGQLKSGEFLREARLVEDLSVSRNTLREGFRLLTQERLVVYEANRGVRVRSLGPGDVNDIYQMRRVLELGAIENAGPALTEPGMLAQVDAAVRDGYAYAYRGMWSAVGTANMEFHVAIVRLAGSERLTVAAESLLAELRLAFGAVEDLQPFHEPYLETNERISDLLRAGKTGQASREMAAYLERAQRQLLAAITP